MRRSDPVSGMRGLTSGRQHLNVQKSGTRHIPDTELNRQAMLLRGITVALMGLLLGGCILNDTLDPVPDSVMSPRDQKLIKSAS